MAYGSDRVTRVQLSDGYWADVRTSLTMGQQKALARMSGSKDGDIEIDLKMDIGSAYLATIIAAWNLDDDDGRILPITSETVDLLHEDDAKAISDAYKPATRTPEEQVAFTPTSTPGPGDAEVTPLLDFPASR